MVLHNENQLQEMFKEFGLGTEEERKVFLQMASGFEFTPAAEVREDAVLPNPADRESEPREGKEDAELARNSG